MNSGFSVNPYGVVDLSELASAKNVPESDARASDTAKISGAIVWEATEENLREILELSGKVPFILVFHSSTSPNSLQLLTILEKIATRYSGKFGLASISTDEQVAVAQAFGITAIPATVALLQGQPIPLFQGLPSENEITQTVEKLLTAAAQYGINSVLSGDETADSEAVMEEKLSPLHQEGLDALNSGDLACAHNAYEKAYKENPADTEAKSALQQVELLQRMEKINPERDLQITQEILDNAQKTDITNIEIHLVAADIEMAYGRPEAAFARLIDVIAATDGAERNEVRQRLLNLFEIIGGSHELVKQARRALANVLF